MLQLFMSSQFASLTIEQLTSLFSAILVLVLAIMVFFQNRRSPLNVLFGLFSFCISLWLFGTFMVFASQTVELQIFWDRFIYLGIIFLPMLLYQFSAAFAQVKVSRWTLLLGYSLTVFFLLISQTDYFVADLFRYGWGAHVKAQFFHHIFLIFFAYFMTRSVALIYGRYKRVSDVIEKQRARYVFAAFAILYIIGPFGFLSAYGIAIYPFAHLSSVPFAFILAFTLTRYRLFNLKAAAVKFFVFILTLFFWFQIFTFDSSEARIVYGSLFVITFLFGLLFIRSAITETNQHEKLEQLTAKLQDLNVHLQERVDEQTIEIKRAYEVEKKARIDLEELDKAKNEFILIVQHHLRTPLTIVKGYIQTALTGSLGSLTENLSLALGKADSAVERLVILTNELLDIFQMEVGKSILNLQQASIKPFIEDAIEELKPEIERKGITVTYPKDQSSWPDLSIDPRKLKEALTVLIDNAVKYNKDKGSVTVTTKSSFHPVEINKKLFQIIIEDTGIGIKQEDISGLFTHHFERGEEAKKIYTTGKGIGLNLAKNIIETHHGRIWVESEGENKGAKFVVELPA